MDSIIVQSNVGDNKLAVENNGLLIRGQINVNLEASEKTRDYEVSDDISAKNVHDPDLTVQTLVENSKMDTLSTEILCDGKASRKKKKRRKSKKAIVKDEGQSLDQNDIDTQFTNNTADGNEIIKMLKIKDEVQSMGQTKMDTGLIKNLAEGYVTLENPEFLDEVQSTDHYRMDIGPTGNIAEGTVTGKRTKKRKRILKAEIEDEIRSKMDARNLAEGNVTTKKPKIKDEVQDTGPTKMDIGSTENPAEGNVNENPKIQDGSQSMHQTNLDNGPGQSSTLEIVDGKRKMKKKRKKKAKPVDEVQNEIDARATENLDEGNVTIEKPKVKDELQSLGQTQMNTGPTENLADVNVIIDNPKFQDEAQSMDQNKIDTWWPAEDLAQGNEAGKRRKKQKRMKKAKVNDEVHSEMDTRSTKNLSDGNVIENPKIQDEAQSMDQNKMETWQPAENLAEGNVTGKQRKKMKKAKANDEVHDEMDNRSTENLADGNVIENPEIQDEAQSMDQNKMDTWRPAENLAEENVTEKRRKKRKKMKKAKANDEVHSEMDTRPTENLAEGNVTLKKPEIKDEVKIVAQTQIDTGSTENVAEGNVIIKNKKFQDEIQTIYQAKMDTGPTRNYAEGNASVKRKKKRKKTKAARLPDEVPVGMGAGSTENLVQVIDEVQSMGLKVMDAGSTENLSKGSVTIENPKNKDEGQSTDKVKMDTGPANFFTKEHVNGKKKRRRKRRSSSTGKASIGNNCINDCEALARPMELEQNICHPNLLVGENVMSVNGLSQVSNAIILDEGLGHAEGRSAISTCNAFTMKDAEALRLKMAPIASIRRKLLVLDINGLLADVVFPAPKQCKEDIKIYGRAVFWRPFCDDFLNFCFQNFDVGIWSSRSKRIIDKIVSYLLEDQKDKLQFCWDMMHSTQTGFKTLENRHKPLVCKELRRIWEKDDPNCPWKKGDYDESNTLLLDDSPYKALLNPVHTAIFPHPYQHSDKSDNSLGPGGDLRVYLEGLLTSENVQKYVEQHPFGQNPITEQDLNWEFYDKVLNQMSNPVDDKTPHFVGETPIAQEAFLVA